MTDHDRIAELREQAFALTPHEQYRLAVFIAENVGYVLTGEPEHPDSPRRALAALPPAGWRDISTAPKDREILVFCPAPNSLTEDSQRVTTWWRERWICDGGQSLAFIPTHWMPLPPAPQRTGE